MDTQQLLESKYQLYTSFGFLLTAQEVALIEQNQDSLIITPEQRELIEKSKQSLDADAELMFKTLQEAESAKNEALARQQQLDELNKELQVKNSVTEAQLDKERQFRLLQDKTDFQKVIAYILAILVGLSVILPYIAKIFGEVPNELLSSTNNIALLIVQGLMIVVSGTFQRKNNESNDTK